MDPNEALRQLRSAAKAFIESDPGIEGEEAHGDALAEARELVEYVNALDEWLSRGGFLPWAWTPPESGGNDPHVVGTVGAEATGEVL